MNLATVLTRPANPMMQTMRVIRLGMKKRVAITPAQVKGLLQYLGMDLKGVAVRLGYKTAAPVSLALHQRRKTPKSAWIVNQLTELVEGAMQ